MTLTDLVNITASGHLMDRATYTSLHNDFETARINNPSSLFFPRQSSAPYEFYAALAKVSGVVEIANKYLKTNTSGSTQNPNVNVAIVALNAQGNEINVTLEAWIDALADVVNASSAEVASVKAAHSTFWDKMYVLDRTKSCPPFC